ncbi:NAD(P)-binding protein [Sparassis latifolia]|uniref:Mitochondrial protein n=1 Tax=Sparassis crispa TaxID=139825 RepID=A0A401GIC9_9APHY|nr:mitochondrial protein [Sparassis crispa]GBE81946.1 mitochondrial protein [Sparassis crispa]
MEPVIQKILVVGGNGFLGSAVCRAALARGMRVTSISSSGRPYTTPKGHSPAWTSKIEWRTGDALQPESYAHLLPGVTAVVHTTGTLFADTRYKNALKDGNVPALLGTLVSNLTASGSSANPLEKRDAPGEYERLNRDAALRVCETFLASPPSVPVNGPRPFIFVSAEDATRPFISARYIETKREAELGIENMTKGRPDYRAVYIRPSMMYHPHFRPVTSPIAALLDLSATIHSKAPSGFPTPSSVLRSLASAFPAASSDPSPLVGPSPLDSIANALTIPPIHVDHVAEAICIAVDQARPDVKGVVGVKEMRDLIGWSSKGQQQSSVRAQPHP